MKAKITITLDEEIANWTRVYAAQNNISVSRLIGQMLANRMLDSEYDRAKRDWLAKSPASLSSPENAYPHRDVLHDRFR